MAFKMKGFPIQQTSALKKHKGGHNRDYTPEEFAALSDEKKQKLAKKEIKKEEKKDPKYVEKIKELEKKYTRKQILDNEGGSQDRLRKLYEKLYPGEEYTP